MVPRRCASLCRSVHHESIHGCHGVRGPNRGSRFSPTDSRRPRRVVAFAHNPPRVRRRRSDPWSLRRPARTRRQVVVLRRMPAASHSSCTRSRPASHSSTPNCARSGSTKPSCRWSTHAHTPCRSLSCTAKRRLRFTQATTTLRPATTGSLPPASFPTASSSTPRARCPRLLSRAASGPNPSSRGRRRPSSSFPTLALLQVDPTPPAGSGGRARA